MMMRSWSQRKPSLPGLRFLSPNARRASHDSTESRAGPESARSARSYSEAEDRMIAQLKDEGHSFGSIALRLGRSPPAVVAHYYQRLFDRSDIPKTVRRSKLFTKAEDNLICSMRKAGEKWRHIAATMTGRSAAAIEQRWRLYLKSLQPHVKTQRPWTASEMDHLDHLKAEKNLSLDDVLEHFPSRSLNAVRSRYHLLVRTRVGPGSRQGRRGVLYTREEDEMIISFRKQGLKWPDIAKRIPTRTSYSLQRRWHARLDARLANDSRPEHLQPPTSSAE